MIELEQQRIPPVAFGLTYYAENNFTTLADGVSGRKDVLDEAMTAILLPEEREPRFDLGFCLSVLSDVCTMAARLLGGLDINCMGQPGSEMDLHLAGGRSVPSRVRRSW